MPKVLKPEAIERLRRDGFYFPIPGVSARQAAGYRRQLEAFEAANGGALKGANRFKTHLLFKWLADLIREAHSQERARNWPEALRIYERVMQQAPPDSREYLESRDAARTLKKFISAGKQGNKATPERFITAHMSETPGAEFR